MKLPFTKESQISAPRLSESPGEELDRELARQMSEGKQEALVRFVDRHLGYLYKHLQRRLGPGHDALIDDVVRATTFVTDIEEYYRCSDERFKFFRNVRPASTLIEISRLGHRDAMVEIEVEAIIEPERLKG